MKHFEHKEWVGEKKNPLKLKEEVIISITDHQNPVPHLFLPVECRKEDLQVSSFFLMDGVDWDEMNLMRMDVVDEQGLSEHLLKQ